MLVRYIGHKNSNDSSVKTKNLRRNIYIMRHFYSYLARGTEANGPNEKQPC